MPINILMPALSPTMTEGSLANWLKKEGDPIKAGDVIAEIETDKATMEVEAVDEGILGKILVDAGTQNVAVNAPIAILLLDGESKADLGKVANTNTLSQPATNVSLANPQSPIPNPPANTQSLMPNANSASARILASPLAKRIAALNNIDLKTVTGTGPHGRIVKSDIEKAIQAPKTAKPTTTPANDTISFDVNGLPNYTLQAHTTMRKVIARRLSESKQTVPHFYLSLDITLDKLLSLRKDINAHDESTKITVNDMLIRACGLALRQVPEANAAWFEDGVHLFERADISVAVAIDGGLITSIVRAACSKRLPEISTTMKDLGARAKAGKLKPEEFTGGTFSLSNLGMFGISHFAAIINPPQGCILAVGAGEERAVVKNGQLAIANQMTCTLSVDHRVVDGAVGAAFLSKLKELIEKPLGLVL